MNILHNYTFFTKNVLFQASFPFEVNFNFLFRLLKEKQEHEDRNNSAPASVPTSCPSSAKSPPASEEPVGSGLPLLQRVLLLKNKDEPPGHSCSQPTSPTTATPTTTVSRSSISLPATSSKPSTISSITHRISFRDRLKLHKDINKELTIRESKESRDLKDPSEITDPSSQRSDSVSDSEKSEPPWSKLKKAAIVRDTSDPSTIPSCSTSVKSRTGKDSVSKNKPSLLTLNRETKNYHSIDDLSPEYGGLPFVKKLKILNERQKLAELESEIKKRSFSLDIPDTQQNPKDDTLTRSHSEGSKMHEDRLTPGNTLLTAQLSPSPIHSSSESNETPERRNLKSILKKLSEDVQVPSLMPPRIDSSELKKLMRAPTIEGYAARHSKLAKSVTFNRDTLPSPPASMNTLGASQNLYPPPNSPSGNGFDDTRKQEEENKLQELEKCGIQLLSAKANQLKILKGKSDNILTILSRI